MSPGPWERSVREGRLILDSSGNDVCMVIGSAKDPNTEANAKAIAALWALVGALQAMVRHCQPDLGATFVLGRAKDALAKAGL
jgi:hypothetical protein